MQPEGTVFNAAWIDALTADIQHVNGCAALQALVNTALATLQAELADIEAKIASLLPLITVPTGLSGVITWIDNFVKPLIQAYETYVAQAVQLAAAVARLTAAIEQAAASFENCDVKVPVLGTVKVT